MVIIPVSFQIRNCKSSTGKKTRRGVTLPSLLSNYFLFRDLGLNGLDLTAIVAAASFTHSVGQTHCAALGARH